MSRDTQTRKPLSQQLEEVIRSSGLSRYEIAKRTGLSQSTLSRFISGERGISQEGLDRLGELFGLQLVADKPQPESNRQSQSASTTRK